MTSVCDLHAWKTLLESEFNRGYLAALVLVLALVVALLILKFVFFLMFRTRRAANVTVKSPDGDIVVTRDAVCEAVVRELERYPELELRKLRLFRRGKAYLLTLDCEFRGSRGVPEVAERLRSQLREKLKELFGIESLRSIGIVVEKIAVPKEAESAAGSDPAPAAADPDLPPPPTADDAAARF